MTTLPRATWTRRHRLRVGLLVSLLGFSPALWACRSPARDDRQVAIGETVAAIDKSCWIIFEDKDGNHWFGSDGNGVCRFDGRTITRFTTKDGLVDNHVRGIQQHVSSGAILISTNEGVSRFDGQRFVTLPVTEMATPEEGWRLDPNDLWIRGRSGPHGPYRYDGTTLYALRFPKSPQEDAWRARYPTAPWNPYDVWCVYPDRRGNIWFGTATLGVCRYDGTMCQWMYESHLSELPQEALFGIRSIVEDRHGDFWICNTRFRFDMKPRREGDRPGSPITYARKPGADLSETGLPETGLAERLLYFMSIVEDERGHLWMVPCAGGVWEFDGRSCKQHPMRVGETELAMYSIYRDRRGTLWVGTLEHGAYRFNGTSFEPFVLPRRP